MLQGTTKKNKELEVTGEQELGKRKSSVGPVENRVCILGIKAE